MAIQKCACIDTLYTEFPFLERFQAAKADGFAFVEFWGWTDRDLPAVRAAAEQANIGIAGFNGDGDCITCSMVDPAQKADYLAFLRRSVDAAKQVGARALTIHSNALDEHGFVRNTYPELSDRVKFDTMYDTLCRCAELAEESGIRMNLEPLNIVTDHVGNFLTSTQMAVELVQMTGSSMLNVLFDAYHMHLNGEDLCTTIRAYGSRIGHVHIADAPGRHEPGTGEIDYPGVYACLEEIGYTGLLGYELFPKHGTAAAVRAIMAD